MEADTLLFIIFSSLYLLSSPNFPQSGQDKIKRLIFSQGRYIKFCTWYLRGVILEWLLSETIRLWVSCPTYISCSNHETTFWSVYNISKIVQMESMLVLITECKLMTIVALLATWYESQYFYSKLIYMFQFRCIIAMNVDWIDDHIFNFSWFF